MGVARLSGSACFNSVNGRLQDNIEARPVNVVCRRDRDLLFWCEANRLAVQFSHRVSEVVIPSEVSVLLPLRSRVLEEPYIPVDVSTSSASLTESFPS